MGLLWDPCPPGSKTFPCSVPAAPSSRGGAFGCGSRSMTPRSRAKSPPSLTVGRMGSAVGMVGWDKKSHSPEGAGIAPLLDLNKPWQFPSPATFAVCWIQSLPGVGLYSLAWRWWRLYELSDHSRVLPTH